MTPKRLPPRIPSVPATALPESNNAELLNQIRHDNPTGTRDLQAIKPHPSPSRALDPRHLVDLARSIAALGLIHPLVLDMEDVVVAGSHRYAALKLLKAEPEDRPGLLAKLCAPVTASVLAALDQPVKLLAVTPGAVDFVRIPVRVLPLSQRAQPDDAWRAEVAENERRRDYSAKEVKQLADRLKTQGYSFSKGPGAGGAEKGLPLLVTVIGKSDRQIRRILSGDEEIRPNVRISFEAEIKSIIKGINRLKSNHADRLGADQHRVLERALGMLGKLAE